MNEQFKSARKVLGEMSVRLSVVAIAFAVGAIGFAYWRIPGVVFAAGLLCTFIPIIIAPSRSHSFERSTNLAAILITMTIAAHFILPLLFFAIP